MLAYPTFSILLSSIESWHDNNASRDQQILYMSDADFLEEFCTISIDLGRRSGKTTAIKALLELYPNSYVAGTRPEFNRFIETSLLGRISPKEDSIVFVDEPYKLFNSMTQDDFYTRMAESKVKLIVMLGKK